MTDSTTSPNELQYIYMVIRQLGCIFDLESSQHAKDFSLNPTIFPITFLLALLDEKLAQLDGFAQQLVLSLFKRLKKSYSQNQNDQPMQQDDWNRNQFSYKELDEYFHLSLSNLYNYLIELDWHDPNVQNLSRSEQEYVKSRLPNIDKFIAFRELLTKIQIKTNQKPKTESPFHVHKISAKQNLSIKRIKSNLSSPSRLNSPSGRRRVRFQTSPKEGEKVEPPRGLSDEQSVLAIDLLIYAINIFIQHLCNRLVDITDTELDTKDHIELIKNSKYKIRVQQLESISKRIKISIDHHLVVLDHLSMIAKKYLVDDVIGVICANDKSRLLQDLKVPRMRVFINRIKIDVERKLIDRLSSRILQLLFEMILKEINLPPIDVNVQSQDKSRKEIVKSQQNYLNFLTSWLIIDNFVFGQSISSKRSSDGLKRWSNNNANLNKNSTLASAGRFRSSSRILAQMDNLSEFAHDVITSTVVRLNDASQVKYFLEFIYLSVDASFEIISAQLLNQFKLLKRNDNSESTADNNIGKNIDSIVAKIRCLKFVHVFSSLDKLIREVADANRLELSDIAMESKLTAFNNNSKD